MTEGLENLFIRICTLEEEFFVCDAYRTAFTSCLGKESIEMGCKRLKEQLAIGHILVAELGNEITGFAGYDFAGDNPEYKELYLERMLYSAQHPECKDSLFEHFKEMQKKYGGEVVLEYFSNHFTQQDVKVLNKDMNLTHLFIFPRWKRKGIGESLAKKRIEIAQENGSSAIYVECWERNGIVQLYQRLGFLPIIRGGPSYTDGSPIVFMGLLLK